MAQCKTVVSPVLMHWRYCSLTLSYWYITLLVLIFSLYTSITMSHTKCKTFCSLIKVTGFIFMIHHIWQIWMCYMKYCRLWSDNVTEEQTGAQTERQVDRGTDGLTDRNRDRQAVLNMTKPFILRGISKYNKCLYVQKITMLDNK